jgi:hypothetical protein
MVLRLTVPELAAALPWEMLCQREPRLQHLVMRLCPYCVLQRKGVAIIRRYGYSPLPFLFSVTSRKRNGGLTRRPGGARDLEGLS